MFSEALQILDRNTELYMIDEMKKEMEELGKELEDKKKELEDNRKELEDNKKELKDRDKRLSKLTEEKNWQIAKLEEEIRRLKAGT